MTPLVRRAIRLTVLALVFIGTVSVLFARGHLKGADDPPALPEDVSYVRERRTPDSYTKEGYVELVGPARPPTSPDHSVRINVFLKLPEGARIRVAEIGSADFTLTMPTGAVAVRVESAGTGDIDAPPSSSWRILDVRGTTFGDRGEQFVVLRPAAKVYGELLGVTWPRGAEQAGPTRALGALVRLGFIGNETGDRAAAAAHLESLNGCASCHAPLRAPRTRMTEAGVVNRGTDSSGLFQVKSVLQDEQPLETYRPTDANVGRPFTTRRCGGNATAAVRCDDGSIMTARLDVRAGVRAHDPHTLRVCASRIRLVERLERPLPAAVSDALTECLSP